MLLNNNRNSQGLDLWSKLNIAMEIIVRLHTIGFIAAVVTLSAGSVSAQQAAEPAPLPQITVEAPKKAAKKAPAKKAPTSKQFAKKAPTTPAPSAQPAGPEQGNGAMSETATGPVDGYVATRSATGSKTDTPLVEVPRTVNVVTRDQIEAQQPQTIKQALGYTPAVQNQTGSGSIFDNIAVRGFTAPIFLDGLRLPTDVGLSFARIRLEPYHLERLEVLKGPASGLFGSSPPGGLINAVSKRPQQTPHNETFVQYGTNEYKAAGFDFTGPLDDAGVLSYRVSGLARDTDLDFDFADRQRYSIAPSLTWRPSADTNLTLLGSAQKDEGFGPHQFVPLSLTKASTAPFGKISRRTYLGEPGFDDYQEEQWQIGYAFEHRFNDVFQVRQNLRYSESEQFLTALRTNRVRPDNRTIESGVNAVDADTSAFAVDTQVQSNFTTGPLKHKLLTGVDYLDIDGSSVFWSVGTTAPGATSIDAYNPVYGRPIANPFLSAPAANSTGILEQTGVYVQDQIKFGGWIATLGARHDWATTDVEDFTARPDVTIKDTAWTYNAGLSYLFDSGLAPYVNYSTSFVPATGLVLINASTGQPLEPTTGVGYEAGLKYQPRGTKTLLSAAIFENTQQNVSISVPPIPLTIVQAGEVRMRGFELEGKASITDNWDIAAGYGYVEPIVTKGTIVGGVSTTGNDFTNVSRHTASFWAMHTWHHGMLDGLGVGAGIRYVGSQFVDSANLSRVPAYTLVDAVLSYELGNVMPKLDGTKIQVNAYNLFDEYYVSACTGGANFCQLGDARSVIATLKYEW